MLKGAAFLCCVSSGALAATSAMAQSQADSASTGLAVDEIVVTANRRLESLQKVPLTATSLGSIGMERARITNLQDVTQKTPSLQVSPSVNAGQVTYIIRGQAQNDTNVGVDASVATYLDDVYLGRSSAAVNNLFDIERVEILEGPQGSLYGRNTTGGAVKIITKKPKLGVFEGYLGGSYSDGPTHRGSISSEEVVINVPAGDNFAVRIGMQNYDREGYFKNQNTGNGIDINQSQSVRISALYQPDDRLSVLLQGDYVRSKIGAQPDVLTQVAPDSSANSLYGEVALANGLDPAVFFRVATGQGSQQDLATFGAALGAAAQSVATQIAAQKKNPYDNTYMDFSSIRGGITDPRDRNWAGGVSASISYDFGGVTLRSITAYRKQNQPVHYDVSGGIKESPIIIPSELYRSRQFSQEVLLNGAAFDERLNWTAGGIYFTETGGEDLYLRSLPRTLAVFGTFATTSDVTAHNKSYAGYGQLAFKVTDRLTAAFGGRYTVDKRQIEGASTVIFTNATGGPGASACSIANLPVGAPCFLTAKAKFTKFTYDGSLQYELTPEKQVYLRYGTGYRSGGTSARLPNTGEFFKPESIKSLEGGFKGSWLNRRLTTNISTFFSKSSNLQQTVTPFITYTVVDDQGAPHTISTGQSLGFNVGSAKIWGASLQASARVSDNLTVSGFYAWQGGKVKTSPFVYDIGSGPVTVSGFFPSKRPPNLPRHTVGVSADLGLPDIGEIAPLLHADFTYRGKQYIASKVGTAPSSFVIANQPFFGQSKVLNASLTFKLPRNVEIAVFAKNILGDNYYNRISTATLFAFATPADPTSIGLSVKVPFGAAAD